MNYAEMSDAQIAAEVLKIKHGKAGFIALYETSAKLIRDYDTFSFDLNDPRDAWPIIDDIFSKLVSTGKYDDDIGFGEREMTVWQAQMHKNNRGKLRAAMIVFLMMNEDK